MGTGQYQQGYACFDKGMTLQGLSLDRSPAARKATIALLLARRALGRTLGPKPEKPGAVDLLDAARVNFFDVMVQAFQPSLPLVAAEASLRCEILGREINDHVVLQRSLAFGAATTVVLGRCTPEHLRRAHATLDRADAMAREQKSSLGREAVLVNRALVWLPEDRDRALECAKAGIEGYRKVGLEGSFEARIARAYLLIVLMYRGEDDATLAHCESILSDPSPEWVTKSIALQFKALILARKGQLALARATVEEKTKRTEGLANTRHNYASILTEVALRNAEGRFREALSLIAEGEAVARACGADAISMDECAWVQLTVEAAIGALRQKTLTAPELKRATARADWLSRKGILGYDALGSRAQGLLALGQGDAQAAARHFQEAIHRSTRAGPGTRWLVLSAASELKQLTTEQHEELERLAKLGQVLPPGW